MKNIAGYRDLLESMPDAILMADADGRIVHANSQAEKMFRYERDELLGRQVEILLPERFRDTHVGSRSAYASHPRTRPMGAGLELHGRRKDGSEFPVEISLSPLHTGDGLLILSAIRDISDRKRIERALQEKAELERASQAKDRFLASISHELRTPLNAIIGFAEFLADGKPGPLNAKQTEYLNDILDSGRHLLHLINDMLDLVKVQAGKTELALEPFSLGDAIAEVRTGVQPIAQKKHIDIEVHDDPRIGIVVLDRQRFKQILYNLLSNALKFTGEGGRVSITAENAGDDRFRLTVGDNGIGIRPQDVGRLFTEFEQLDNGTARRFGGTGLGLALTRTFTHLHGGEIRVESEPGKGSRFTVELPRSGPGERP